ncbi:hypothetical protein ACH4SP_30855 [Streptomyces sp. NPDC021093]|uniref:hypothetical protein n=1 Tax=Streptomyces sp. NPDC021093 TaxID=3365112 RepID=UPI0037BD8387
MVTPRYGDRASDHFVASDGRSITLRMWRRWLACLEADDSGGIAEVWEVLAKVALDSGIPGWPEGDLTHKPDNGRTTIDRITNTLSDATVDGPVIQVGHVGSFHQNRHVAGDNVDLTGNTINGQVIGVQTVHHAPPTAHDWRPVREVGPIEFGVRPTRRVHLRDAPPYAERDRDRELAEWLAHTGLVLILAKPLAGTSHTAWNAVTQMDGHRLYAPEPGTDLRTLPADLKNERGKYVLWLDDITDHLGAGGLTHSLLGRLTALGVVVLATMDPDAHYARRTERVLAAAHTVELEREWSDREFARLLPFVQDGCVAEIYEHGDRAHVAAHFAFGHLLRDEWHRPGTRTAHPRGHLLVRAAVELAGCGVRTPVPESLLRRLCEGYAAEADGVAKESYEEAFAWATAEHFGIPGFSLLAPARGPGFWRAHGALVAGEWPVTDEVRERILRETQDEEDIDSDDLERSYCDVLRPRAESGDLAAMVRLGRLAPKFTEALTWYRRAADAGSVAAAAELGQLLSELDGSEAEAVKYLEAAARGGHHPSAAVLGRFLLDRARHWLGVAGAPEATALRSLLDPPEATVGAGTDGPPAEPAPFRIDYSPPVDYSPQAWYLPGGSLSEPPSRPRENTPGSAPG